MAFSPWLRQLSEMIRVFLLIINIYQSYNNSLKPTVNACHVLCEKMANPAPRYGGLIPPFHRNIINQEFKQN